ncbi:MAG: HAD-IA family hydrolase, partial [Clostridiales bacterium]|nr:HAD-IA family hydrolase [Clostridiales bacterium]
IYQRLLDLMEVKPSEAIFIDDLAENIQGAVSAGIHGIQFISTEQAVVREALEETGLSIEIVKLLGVYSEPSRDPRGHTVSICYLAKGTGILKAGSDAAEVAQFTIDCIPRLAFDHNHIIDQSRVDINGVLSKV